MPFRLADPAYSAEPGTRSPAWLKLKPTLKLDVVVTGGSAGRMQWGDWGEAVMLAFRYTHPRTGADGDYILDRPNNSKAKCAKATKKRRKK